MLHVTIRVRARLEAHWARWFEPLALRETATGETILSGELPDQAALYGLLARLRDLGLTLIAVETENSGAPA